MPAVRAASWQVFVVMTIPGTYPVYPFSAIVGQERLKRALILNAINPHVGGVLIRGEKGTAKSTAVRGLTRLLPPIKVVPGCVYHCSPEQPAGLCSMCQNHHSSESPLHSIEQPTHLVEMPVSASEDRVVGSLDIEHAITEGERRFEPGLLAQVNRGVLYVDEVNLLDDHLVDLLLDAAAMGVNTVEREGMSISHPARFILIGTMNPEEGELRPQLLDRFGLAVEIHGLKEVNTRTAVIERRFEYEAAPANFIAKWQPEEQQLATRIIKARNLLPDVRIRKADMTLVAALSLELNVDGHRADLTILETARTHAAWEGRTTLNQQDIQMAAELALPHRMRRQPFAEATMDSDYIQSFLERHNQQINTQAIQEQDGSQGEKKTLVTEDEITQAAPHAEWDGSQVIVGTMESAGSPGSSQPAQNETNANDMVYEANEIFQARKIEGQRDHRERQVTGKRSRTSSSRRQGRYIRSMQVHRVTDLAFDATLRAAAPYQQRRRTKQTNPCPSPAAAQKTAYAHPPQQKEPRIVLYRSDLRQKVRIHRTRNAVCFVVDASWSMAAEERMCATKAAILSLLRDAYQRRDLVGLVSFQRTYATILLPLTNSVELAQKRLQTMPIGGKTPLARGLLTGYEVLERARKGNPEIIPMLVILTDGQANVAMTNMTPQQESYRVAEFIADHDMRCVVIDTEFTGSEQAPNSMISAHASRAQLRFSHLDQGLARYLSEHLHAEYYRLEELRDGGLAQMVRTQLHRQR